jgi:Flp pilus assembly protein CpaB
MKRVGSSQRSRRSTGGRTLLLGVAIPVALGVGLALGGSAKAKSSEKTIHVPDYEVVYLPVPKDIVPAGTKGSEIATEMVAFPKDIIPAKVLYSLASVHESRSATALPARLPLVEANFSYARSQANPVLERIPEGMRAITINVDIASAVEGWAGSGSHVDVLLVTRQKTVVIAENVEILSAERSVEPIEGEEAPSVPRTVTILVNQAQALAIVTAIPKGRISFALRRASDESSWDVTEFEASKLTDTGAELSSDSEVTGYVRYTDKGEKKGFALTSGKWIPSISEPAGTLLNSAHQKVQP